MCRDERRGRMTKEGTRRQRRKERREDLKKRGPDSEEKE